MSKQILSAARHRRLSLTKELIFGASVLHLGILGLTVTSALVLGAASASAGDMTWTGFYVGANGGGAWNAGDQDLTTSITSDFPDFGPDGDAVTFWAKKQLDSSGGFGGGQFGYNWQMGGLVFGLEADAQGADISDSQNLNLRAPFGLDGGVEEPDDATASAKAETTLDVFGSVRGRIGYAFNRTLIYGTGGLAFGQVKDTLTVVAVDADDPDPIERIVPLSTHTVENDSGDFGFAVGGGFEHLFSQSLSLKAEYQYIDLGSDRLWVTSDNRGDHAEGTTEFDHTYHTFRVGLNYHFYTGADEALK